MPAVCQTATLAPGWMPVHPTMYTAPSAAYLVASPDYMAAVNYRSPTTALYMPADPSYSMATVNYETPATALYASAAPTWGGPQALLYAMAPEFPLSMSMAPPMAHSGSIAPVHGQLISSNPVQQQLIHSIPVHGARHHTPLQQAYAAPPYASTTWDHWGCASGRI